MGVIKDGKIYGKLPSEEVFAVHYPAYASSVERAIDTLGGIQGISKARSSDTNKLEVRFRPEDPYSHPAFGELHHCSSFLLKISKVNAANAQKKGVPSRVSNGLPSTSLDFDKEMSSKDAEKLNKPPTEPVASDGQTEALVSQEADDQFTADVVASVSKAYHFNGMADYQHVPAVHANVAKKKKYAEFENAGFMDVDEDEFVALLPPLFSNKDLPTNVVLRPSASVASLKRKQDGLADYYWECDIEPSLALDFFITEIPKRVDWEKHIPRHSEEWEWQKAVCELFDERPIWVKESVKVRLSDKGLKFQGNMLRKLLFRTAYYFSNGPFLRFWIKKGYDPRKDPESRIYQRTDFRVPPALRSYCDVTTSGSKRWRDLLNFQTYPTKCFTSFQLFELADDYIQEEIRKPPTQSTCTCATGWFSFTVLQTFRNCVAMRFLSVYPNGPASSLLKSACKQFEKSKRLCLFPKEVQQQSEEQEASHTEIIDNGDNEPNKSDHEDDEPNKSDHEDDEPSKSDDEEEEDDDVIEDDNVEDDLEAYEDLDLDANFSPRPHTESNFLQELFVNFPDNNNEVVDNETSHAKGGIGEYHIYEHSSDYSDDDD